MVKKIIVLMMAAMLGMGILAGCAGKEEQEEIKQQEVEIEETEKEEEQEDLSQPEEVHYDKNLTDEELEKFKHDSYFDYAYLGKEFSKRKNGV